MSLRRAPAASPRTPPAWLPLSFLRLSRRGTVWRRVPPEGRLAAVLGLGSEAQSFESWGGVGGGGTGQRGGVGGRVFGERKCQAGSSGSYDLPGPGSWFGGAGKPGGRGWLRAPRRAWSLRLYFFSSTSVLKSVPGWILGSNWGHPLAQAQGVVDVA